MYSSEKTQKLNYDTIDNFLPDRVNRNDPRYREAVSVFEDTNNNTHFLEIYKTTRAGATVALCAESINRKELITLVCRTNRVITQTIKGDVVDHTQKYKTNPVHITRNSFCTKMTDLIRKYPSVQLLGTLPLPNCDKCNISARKCPIRYAFETPAQKVDVYCLTYAKLASVMLYKGHNIEKKG